MDYPRPPIILAAIFSLIVVLPACQGSTDDGDEARKRRLERQAAQRPNKAKVDIGAIHHFEGVAPGGPVRTELDDGTTLEIREAYLVVSAVELHACEPGLDDYESPDGPVLNDLVPDLWPLVGGTARAHVPDSSTRMGTPFVEDLLAEPGRARIAGELAPPLAAYCRAAAILAPADRDVANTTDVATSAIDGHTLLIRGRRRPDPEADWTSFEFTTDVARAIEFPARDPRTGQTPLVLDNPQASSMLLVDKLLRPSTFATDLDADDAGEAIVDRLADTLQTHTYD